MREWIRTMALCLVVFSFACGDSTGDSQNTDEGGDESASTETGTEPDVTSGEEGTADVGQVDAGDLPDHELLVAEVMLEAQKRYPNYKQLHQNGVNPKCGPVGGVCHNTKEYPDLHTSANMIDVIGMGCNYLADNPPEITENLCEPHGDVLIITTGPDVGFEAAIGMLEVMPEMLPCGSEIPDGADVQDENGYPTLDLCISLSAPVPTGPVIGEELVSFSVIRRDPETGEQLVLMQYENMLESEGGSNWVRFRAFSDLEGSAQDVFLYSLRKGDLNGDGIFGALTEESGLIIKPGDPERSYLVWRMLGWGQAPRMPLAEEPFDPPTQLAVMCWIKNLKEGEVPNPVDDIDYSECENLLEHLVFEEEEEE